MKTITTRHATFGGETRFWAPDAHALTDATHLGRAKAGVHRHVAIRYGAIAARAPLASQGKAERKGVSARDLGSQRTDLELWAIAERWVQAIAWLSVGITILIDVAVTFGPTLGWV